MGRLRDGAVGSVRSSALVGWGIGLSVLLIVCCLTLTITSGAFAGDLYFLSDMRGLCGSARLPCPTKLLQYDSINQRAVEIDRLVDSTQGLIRIEVYLELGFALMQRGGGCLQTLYRIPFSAPAFHRLWSVTDDSVIREYRVLIAGDKAYVEVGVGKLGHLDAITSLLVSDEGELTQPSAIASQLLVAGDGGLRSFYAVDDSGRWVLVRGQASPCLDRPDSLIPMRSDYGWAEIWRRPGLVMFASAADRPGLLSRQLLICRPEGGKWQVVSIRGAHTLVQPLGNWIAGVVCDADPRTDFDGHVGYDPVCTDSCVIMRADSLRPFYARLGPDCEILGLTDSTTLCYRTGQELWTAQIGEGDLRNRILLMTDPRVRFVHWAFRGNESR